MACPNDIEVKVNVQSCIKTSFYTIECEKKNAATGLCTFTFTYIYTPYDHL